MSAPTERTMNYGLRYAVTYALNTSGTPKAVDTTAYDGLQFQGSTAFELTVPDSRQLTGLGEDGITQVVFLPPNEGASGRLNVEAADPAVSSLLDNTLVETLGEASLLGIATDRQGFEPQVGLMVYQAARGLITGKTYWHTYIMPSAQVVRKAGGMNADKAVTGYQIAPNRVSKHLWGTPFSLVTNGFLSAQIVEAWSNYPLRISAFLADGTEDVFLFPTNSQAIQTPGIKVWKNDVLVAAGITLATTGVTFAVAPTAADRIVILRETAG